MNEMPETAKQLIYLTARVAELEAGIREHRACIMDLIMQFGTVSLGMISSGGLGALEAAFELLGWPDPCPAPKHMICDEPGCLEQATWGRPSLAGYRRTCGKHRN